MNRRKLTDLALILSVLICTAIWSQTPPTIRGITWTSGTMNLQGAYYELSGIQQIPDNTTVIGVAGVTELRAAAGPDGYAFRITGSNVTFKNCTIKGGGFFIDCANGYNKRIVFDNCVFLIDATGSSNNAITATSGLEDSSITNNRFTSVNYRCGFGIYGYNRNRLRIAQNEFVDIPAGIHIDSFNPNDADTIVEQNLFQGMKGMGCEMQTYGLRTIIRDNLFWKPNLSTVFAQNDGCMAYSIIMDRSTGSQIYRNSVIAPERPDGKGCRIGIEAGGDGCQVFENYMNGINHSIACNDGYGTTDVTLTNNMLLNQLEAPRGKGMILKGINGGNAPLSWNPARGTPGRNKTLTLTGYAGNTPVPPIVTPDPTVPLPSTRPATQPTGTFVWASDLAYTVIANGWGPVEKNTSNGESLPGDGNPITIAGWVYPKGLGVHAAAQVRFATAAFQTIAGDVGIDDEVGPNGSVNVQLYSGDLRLWESGTITGQGGPKAFSVDLTNVATLDIKVVGATSGDFGHTDFGNLRLIPKTAPSVDPITEVQIRHQSGRIVTDKP